MGQQGTPNGAEEAIMAHVEVLEEVRDGDPTDWNLCFQWARYHYDDGEDPELGYRFIWRREDETLQPARGQARIPSAASLLRLLGAASSAGWFVAAEQAEVHR